MRGATFVATLCLMLTATTDGRSFGKKRKKVGTIDIDTRIDAPQPSAVQHTSIPILGRFGVLDFGVCGTAAVYVLVTAILLCNL